MIIKIRCMMRGVMSFAYFPGSTAHKRLMEIARRMHARVATNFNGVTINGTNILYRHGTAYLQPMHGHKYPRWSWKKPFGKPSDLRTVDYVLLCGPEVGQADEAFFLFTSREAFDLRRAWPDVLNVAALPVHDARAARDKILKHQRTLREVIRTVS